MATRLLRIRRVRREFGATASRGVWHLDESPADGAANAHQDSTVSATHGTPQGFQNDGVAGTNATGLMDGADHFERAANTDDRVDAADAASLTPSGDLTISSWLRADSIPGITYLAQKAHGVAPFFSYQVWVASDGSMGFNWADSGGTNYGVGATGPGVFSTGAWHHVVAVRDTAGAQIRLFLDGAMVGTPTGVSGALLNLDSNGPLHLGNRQNLDASPDGIVDEPRIASAARSQSWIQTEFNNAMNQGVGAGQFILSLGGELAGYNLFRPITIDRARIPGGCGATLTNYPMLFNVTNVPDLAHTGSGGAVTDLQGDDIIFRAASDTACGGAGLAPCVLDHEVEKYVPGTGELVAWVRIPAVNTAAAGTDTVIQIMYGNADVTTPTENPAGVWESNYECVYHLEETVVDEASVVDAHTDSTSNNNHGDQNGNVNTGAKIADGQSFDAADTIVGTTTGFATDDGTIEFWIRPNWNASEGAPAREFYKAVVTAWDQNAVMVKKHSTQELQGFISDPNPGFYRMKTQNPFNWIAGEWHHVFFTWDSSPVVTLYVDGVEVGGPWPPAPGGLPTALPATFILGDAINNMDGVMDEFRVSSTARSSCWAAATHSNHDLPGDLGAPEFYTVGAPLTTKVELVSFGARGVDGAVELSWETASELNNLGFHLYRSPSESGPYTRVSDTAIPGLGSSPVGARYRYRDDGLVNGNTYSYKLEDIDASGGKTVHGPVAAIPVAGAVSESPPPQREEHDVDARLSYGDPAESAFRIEPRSHGVVLHLETGGFVAVPQDDGSVRLEAPGLEELAGASLPAKRVSVDAIAGRDVKIQSVRVQEVERFDGLRPSHSLQSELAASTRGTVRARLKRRGRRHAQREGASLIDVAYQGESKKALVELSPFTWDGHGIVLAKKLEVTLVFRGREASTAPHRAKGKPGWRLATVDPGLYAVRLDDLLGKRRAQRTERLRLSRGGHDVAYYLERRVLYFWSEGAAGNPYGSEAIYELELGARGEAMAVTDAPTSSDTFYWHTLEREENRYYQAGLIHAPDLWLWELLFAPERKSFPFHVSELASEVATLELWLQGASDLPPVNDHHVRVYVNGSFVTETRWDGKNPRRIEASVVVREGDNVVELENVDDTGADYSMVMLDRFELRYARNASVLRDAAFVLDVTGQFPSWVRTRDGFDAGRDYVTADETLRPIPRKVKATKLRKRRRADYLVIGPQILLDAAKPLLRHRKRQGLRVVTASTEAIASEFGHGELSPDAIRELIRHAYHEWKGNKLRYVLLLGDATYDFKDYMGTGVTNQVPPYMVRTAYLWTASDPAYAAVNGDDLLPDIAIGRLPAKNVHELDVMVDKIVAYERGELPLDAPFVLVADDADRAGDFEADADTIAATLLAGRDTKRIYLRELGASATRDAIVESFDAGASAVSYLGHGGIHLWADENVFNREDVGGLSPQAQQPLLLTMNCLNGYFHFPFFDSLAEELVQTPNRGAIAAFSPSGLSLNGPANLYHRALLEELFDEAHERLGDAVLDAQKEYAETGAMPELLAIYHLFGDPALTLR